MLSSWIAIRRTTVRFDLPHTLQIFLNRWSQARRTGGSSGAVVKLHSEGRRSFRPLYRRSPNNLRLNRRSFHGEASLHLQLSTCRSKRHPIRVRRAWNSYITVAYCPAASTGRGVRAVEGGGIKTLSVFKSWWAIYQENNLCTSEETG